MRAPIAVGADKKGAQAIVRSLCGLTTKIHAYVEGLGKLVFCIFTGGQANDIMPAVALLQGSKPDKVVADKAYDADALLWSIETIDAKVVIPLRSIRKVQRCLDRSQYGNCDVIERFITPIKQFRRVATRYEKLAPRFESFVIIAALTLWLK